MSERLRREVDPVGTESATVSGGPRLFRKKPVVIEAVRLSPENAPAVAAWSGGYTSGYPALEAVYVRTLEGVMRADVGDWVIKGVKGEFYPCKSDIFEASYEAVDAV